MGAEGTGHIGTVAHTFRRRTLASLKLSKTNLPTLSSAAIALAACLAYPARVNGSLVVVTNTAAWLAARARREAVDSPPSGTGEIRRVAPTVWVVFAV
jgi:hypothetical protein